ncbi:divergent PAP2 family protein, partial [Bacillus velezensis]|uniref:divergent PAP2 family protein n=1 Tax=Bacillus velezensis TaxID=492670 RepID=UPI002DBA313A
MKKHFSLILFYQTKGVFCSFSIRSESADTERMSHMDVLMNFPLLASFAAIIFAQVVKVPIQFIVSKKLDWSLVTSTGG